MNRCQIFFAVVLLTLLGGVARGQSAWYEGFEGQSATWHEAGANAPYRLLKHQRVQGPDAHSGQGCEWLQVSADGGTYIYVSHTLGQPRIIAELMPSVWIKSDRPGITLLVRVVLPRTLDRRSNRPIATLLMGPNYSDVGRWQQLRMTDVPQLLTRQIQRLHAELGPNIDDREAYVDAVFLNVYGGPGATNVWIDDLDVAGYIRSNAPDASPASSSAPIAHEIKFSGSILSIDGHAFFPRVIEYQGEPLGYLKQLGFNTVWLNRPPTPEILEEAARWGLWVVCPPPGDSPNIPINEKGIAPSSATGKPLTEIGPAYQSVLLWNLGDQLTAEQLEATRIWARQVRAADGRAGRPLICSPAAESRGYSRLVDLLLIDRRPLGTSLELKDYGTWVHRRPLLARLGTPVWTTLQTQLAESWRQQVAALSSPLLPLPMGEGRGEGDHLENEVNDAVDYEQLRLMAYTAVASGTRGLLFLSSRPLNGSDRSVRQRAAALELLNLELAMLEPWGAAGKFVADAESSSPNATGTVLRTEHARLLMPLLFAPGAQYAVGSSSVPQLSLVVPGVPEACNAYEMTPVGLQPLRHQRVAGGIRVDLDKLVMTSQVLLANDPLILAGVTRRAAELGRRAGQLQRQLAVEKLQRLQGLSPLLGQKTAVGPKSGEWLAAAARNLQTCDRQLAAGDLNGAAVASAQSMSLLRQIERSYWDFAAAKLDSPVTSPPAVSFATLPLHWRLIDRIRAAQFGPNLLPGGDFEDLNQTWTLGWRHGKYPSPGVRTDAALIPGCAHSGRLGLRLSVTPELPETAPEMIECPPQWFTSPPIGVTAGQVLCIHGWVKVSRAVTGSVDGLMIYDTLGGEALAERIGQTQGWREFALYRAAPQNGTMTVIFAMTGLGEAWLDDVQVQALEGGNR
jgi:hypothetical protein